MKQTRTEQLSIKIQSHPSVLNNDRATHTNTLFCSTLVTVPPFARRRVDTRTHALQTPLVDSCNSPAPSTVYTRHQIPSTSSPPVDHIAGLGSSVLGCRNPLHQTSALKARSPAPHCQILHQTCSVGVGNLNWNCVLGKSSAQQHSQEKSSCVLLGQFWTRNPLAHAAGESA